MIEAILAVLCGVAIARKGPHWLSASLWTTTTLSAFTGVLHAFGFLAGIMPPDFQPSTNSRALDALVIGLALLMSNVSVWTEHD